MSSSEELSQYESKPKKSFKPFKNTAQDGDRPEIPRDVHGLFGVHVSNLPSGISEMALEKSFSSVGRVQVCKLMEKKYFPVYAFVKYSLLNEAQDALLKFDGYKLNGSVLSVRPAYVSQRLKRSLSPGTKKDHWETSSEEDRNSRKENEREKNQSTTFVMGSSDCRLKDGKLNDNDVTMFDGTRKANGGRLLAPRFQKDSPPKSSASNNSHESHEFRDNPPSRMSVAPSSSAQRHTEPFHQQVPISAGQASPGHAHSNDNSRSSAFRPYQGNTQEPIMQNGASVQNGIITVASTLSHLGLSPPENKSAPTWNHSQGNEDLSWRQGGAQGMTSWSQTGGIGIMSWSNSKDRSATSPEWSPQARAGVSSWSTADVVQFFHSSDCAEYAGFFQEQEIDGKALLLLNRDTLLQFMKVGPALKVLQLIDELRSCGPPPVTGSNGW